MVLAIFRFCKGVAVRRLLRSSRSVLRIAVSMGFRDGLSAIAPPLHRTAVVKLCRDIFAQQMRHFINPRSLVGASPKVKRVPCRDKKHGSYDGDQLYPLGRAYALEGDKAKARAAYEDFFKLWKDADPDIPWRVHLVEAVDAPKATVSGFSVTFASPKSRIFCRLTGRASTRGKSDRATGVDASL